MAPGSLETPPTAPAPWFAVTMTVRNNVRTLRESLGTILPHLADGGELVIVDALSDDGTQEILRELAAADPRLTVIEKACNRGIGRNLAVASSHAPIVLTQVDGDNRYVDGVLRTVAARLRETPTWDAAFAVGAHDWDPSSTRFYAWRRAGFDRTGGYEERQEREDPPLLLRAFRAGLRVERCLLPKLADDLKPRAKGRAPSVSPWRRGTHTMWAARKFRVMGYRYSEYLRLLRLTRRTEPRFLAGGAIGLLAYAQGALHHDGPDVLERDDEVRPAGSIPPASPSGAPGPR
ncbi:MAG: glycosyltransferase [Thermoplasmata archaeon]|jgi:glycosyltransferase involved in cell wall biosynthesis|nr:glycosyltransferase [Thermoplasmata archaeon]